MTSPRAGGADAYTHGHHASVVGQHARRTAAEAAAFLLPRLKPDMRLLDFGCGPGSITVGLAERVFPGLVTAVDVAPDVLQQARTLATQKGITNISFEEGSVYALAFPDAAFDVAYGHQVLQHLSRPHAALLELKRVLRPGGLLAVRDSDYAKMIFAPDDDRLERFFEIYDAVARRNGGEPNAGRYLRGWLQRTGFEEISGSQDKAVFAKQVINHNCSTSCSAAHANQIAIGDLP